MIADITAERADIAENRVVRAYQRNAEKQVHARYDLKRIHAVQPYTVAEQRDIVRYILPRQPKVDRKIIGDLVRDRLLDRIPYLSRLSITYLLSVSIVWKCSLSTPIMDTPNS